MNISFSDPQTRAIGLLLAAGGATQSPDNDLRTLLRAQAPIISR